MELLKTGRGFTPSLPHPNKIFIGRVQLGHSRKLHGFSENTRICKSELKKIQ
jgi:hypothetical protein